MTKKMKELRSSCKSFMGGKGEEKRYKNKTKIKICTDGNIQ